MKRPINGDYLSSIRITTYVILVTTVLHIQIWGQEDSAKRVNAAFLSVLGEVIDVNSSSKRLRIKKHDESILTISYSDNTDFSRVLPGETTLQNAVTILPADINKGDRLYTRGWLEEKGQLLTARSIVIMSRIEISEKQERERNAWSYRSIAGKVSNVSLQKKEIMLLVATPQGERKITIDANSPSVEIRRYAVDSINFEKSSPGSFEEIKVGDRLRSLGGLSSSNRFLPEKIVFGSFQTIGGTVSAVDPQKNEITIKALPDGRSIFVTVTENSIVRRVSPGVASALVRQVANKALPPRSADSSPIGNGIVSESVKTNADLQDDIERSPKLDTSEVKPGDMVLATTGDAGQAKSVKAAVFLVGVESILSLFKLSPNPKNANRTTLNTGLPLSVLDGIGVQ